MKTTSGLLIIAFAFVAFIETGCKKCVCCGIPIAYWQCTKDTSEVHQAWEPNTAPKDSQSILDTMAFYEARGYSCIQSGGESSVTYYCGNDAKQAIKNPSLHCWDPIQREEQNPCQ